MQSARNCSAHAIRLSLCRVCAIARRCGGRDDEEDIDHSVRHGRLPVRRRRSVEQPNIAVARGQNVLKTAQLQQAMSGDYLGGRAARRFAGTPLRRLVAGFVASAASNNCRSPCANSSTAFPKAPSCPTRTIATDRCRSNDGGRNTFTGSIERFLAIKRAGSSPTP
jgi:hypothetical protein